MGGSDQNTGCDAVKRIVSALADAGKNSVLGLIDWDGLNSETSRLAVLAKGSRDGLENVIFDPLAIALLISRELPDKKQLIDIPREVNYLQFAQLRQELMQRAVDKTIELVLGSPNLRDLSACYSGGFSLFLDHRYLLYDDHGLEKLILEVFPFLQEISKSRSSVLINKIISNVFADTPAAMPVEIEYVFRDLLSRNIN